MISVWHGKGNLLNCSGQGAIMIEIGKIMDKMGNKLVVYGSMIRLVWESFVCDITYENELEMTSDSIH